MVSGTSGDAGASTSHQPGVSPPLSPIRGRDEETELASPAAVAPPRPSRDTPLQRSGSNAGSISHPLSPEKGKQADYSRVTYPPESPTDFKSVDMGRGMGSEVPVLSTMPSRVSGNAISVTSASDPLLLRSRKVEESDLRYRPTGKGFRAKKSLKTFYEAQNNHIENLLKPLHAHGEDDAEDRANNAIQVKIAIYGSFAANCILAILQLYAAISSLSLSLFATAADSVFDPFANLALLLLHKKSGKVDERKWPAGGSRFENVANCVYAFLMGCVSIVLIVESIRDLVTNGEDKTFNVASLVAVGVAFAVKLALFLYCTAYRRFSSQIEVLAIDHRNDLGINGLGILTSALGSKVVWWLDPVGAMIISVIIVTVWSFTAAENFSELAGKGAPPDFLQLITYNVMLFHEQIEKIDSVKAYHSGPQYNVEVDIVMNPGTPLREAHDVAQSLQDKLEGLPDVDRCFIHIDYETDHAPEHRKKV